MIVPNHWAEARKTVRVKGRPITLRRFGWSDDSAADAQARADLRVAEAAQLAASGQQVLRREPKVPYNGGEGLPIREEVLARHGAAVITRNAYGAHCLNVPDLLIADVDFEAPPPQHHMLLSWPVALLAGGLLIFALRGWQGIVAGAAVVLGAALWRRLLRRRQLAQNPPESGARQRIFDFAAQHPDWRLRLYRTPAGQRLIATHARFMPASEAVENFFQAVNADTAYGAMCRVQQCFRARLTAKPWRAGIKDLPKPRPGVWPISPARMPARAAWVARYENAAAGFAACRYEETLGQAAQDPDLAHWVALHDRLSNALDATRPLA